MRAWFAGSTLRSDLHRSVRTAAAAAVALLVVAPASAADLGAYGYGYNADVDERRFFDRPPHMRLFAAGTTAESVSRYMLMPREASLRRAAAIRSAYASRYAPGTKYENPVLGTVPAY